MTIMRGMGNPIACSRLRRSRDIKPSRVAGKPACIVPTPSASHGGTRRHVGADRPDRGRRARPGAYRGDPGEDRGHGGVNNFTSEYICATIAATLAPYLHAIVAEVERQIAMVVSCGRTDALHHG